MKYYDKIDGLRFVAIFAVLVHHFASYLSTRIDWGYYGVDLFFVISGFLISSILLTSGKKSFGSTYKSFIGRRVLRIFPLYYVSILILFVLNAPGVRENITSLLTYTFNYVFPKLPTDEINAVRHFWSLCVEEQFYLFWPLLLIAFRRNKYVILGLCLAFISFAYLQIYFDIVKSLSVYNYSGLPARMGSLGLGCLGALLINKFSIPESFFRNLWVELLFYLMLGFALWYSQYLLMGITSLYFVLKAAYNGYRIKAVNRLLSNRRVRYIGSISYGIYIFHFPIGYFFLAGVFDHFWLKIDFESLGVFSRLQWHSWLIKFPLFSGITILLAGISYRYFEKPLLNLKDIFFKY